MHRRRLTRALTALALPALAIPALVAPATAGTARAATAPAVPTIAAVAKIYPYLDGGTVSSSTSKVQGPGKDCKPGRAIKGAAARYASYSPATIDPEHYMTGDQPLVSTGAMRFPTATSAKQYLHARSTSTKDCPPVPSGGGSDVDAEVTPIRFRLGDERYGYTVTVTSDGQTMIMQTLLVRDGRFIVTGNAMSADGSAPSVPKAISLTKAALTAVH